MLTVLEKYWPLISALFFVILLTALLFYPSASATLATSLLVLSLGMAVLFIMHRQVGSYRVERISRTTLFRNMFVEVSGLLLTIALAAYLAQRLHAWIVAFASGAVSIVIAIVMSLLIGLSVSWLVRMTWGRLARA